MADPAPHVLVVDDDEPSLRLARRALEGRGYRVTAAPWPDLGATGLGRLRLDAVVLDLMFGGRPLGLGFLAELRADPATEALPVVVWSADVFGARAAELALADSGCRFLLKPTRPAELVAAVAACLRRVALPPAPFVVGAESAAAAP